MADFFFSSYEGFSCLDDQDGKMIWHQNETIDLGFALNQDKLLTSLGRCIQCIDIDGKLIWEYQVQADKACPVAYNPDKEELIFLAAIDKPLLRYTIEAISPPKEKYDVLFHLKSSQP